MVFGVDLPLFRTKKEAFEWLRTGKKTIDVRRGEPLKGEVAVYLSGRRVLRFRILKREAGRIEDVVRLDNFRLIIPSALSLEEAVGYLRGLYGGCDGVFTAYFVEPLSS